MKMPPDGAGVLPNKLGWLLGGLVCAAGSGAAGLGSCDAAGAGVVEAPKMEVCSTAGVFWPSEGAAEGVADGKPKAGAEAGWLVVAPKAGILAGSLVAGAGVVEPKTLPLGLGVLPNRLLAWGAAGVVLASVASLPNMLVDGG